MPAWESQLWETLTRWLPCTFERIKCPKAWATQIGLIQNLNDLTLFIFFHEKIVHKVIRVVFESCGPFLTNPRQRCKCSLLLSYFCLLYLQIPTDAFCFFFRWLGSGGELHRCLHTDPRDPSPPWGNLIRVPGFRCQRSGKKNGIDTQYNLVSLKSDHLQS